MKLWITKLAMTKGILEVDREPDADGLIEMRFRPGWTSWLGPKWYSNSLAHAEAMVCEMVRKKRASLQKQLRNLEGATARAIVVTKLP